MNTGGEGNVLDCLKELNLITWVINIGGHSLAEFTEREMRLQKDGQRGAMPLPLKMQEGVQVASRL